MTAADTRGAESGVSVATLSNGLRVATDTMPGVASATLGVWVGAGGRHETAAETGTAHFLEHMAFKGTPTRTARAIAEEIEDVGGDLNAYTGRETTAYHARVLAEDAPRAMRIIADILRNPLFTAEDVALEQGVILQEIGQSRDTPDDVVFDWAQETAYPNQPIGRPILGDEASVCAVDGGRLRGFMEALYTPDRMIVGAAGAVDHQEIVTLAEELFGDLPARPQRAADSAAYGGGERRDVKPLEQAHVVLGFEGPNYLSEDFYAAQVAATVLGGGMSSRLFQEVREKRGLAYAVFAQAQSYRDSGLMTIYAGSSGESVGDLLEVIAGELRGLAEDANETETARARAQIRAGLLMGLESSGARAERAARGLLAHGRIRTAEELLAKIDAVDADRVRAFAARLLAGAQPTMTLYGPVAGAPSLDDFRERLVS